MNFYFMVKLNLFKKGFTLVELCSMAILGVLAAVELQLFWFYQ